MARDLDILGWLRRLDLNVKEVAGWQTRGSSTFTSRGHLTHHTAGPRKGVAPTLNACINGLNRPDLGYYLPGPLCQTYTDRNNVVYLIASGRANHSGRGSFRHLNSSSQVSGTEHEHSGYTTEPVSAARLETIARVTAAHALSGGFGAEMCINHFEWTRRKIDFVRGDHHMVAADHRRRVGELIAAHRGGARPTPAPPKETFLMALTDKQQDELLTLARRIDQNAENAVTETRSISAALGRLGEVTKQARIYAARGYAYARTGALDGLSKEEHAEIRAEAARIDPSNK